MLGGAGSAGNAWVIGVVTGLGDVGVDVTDPDLIVGTSSGSTAATQSGCVTTLFELFTAIIEAGAPPPAAARCRRMAVDLGCRPWRPPAAQAGYGQGRALGASLTELWTA